MLKSERQRAIRETIRRGGSVSAAAMAAQLGVSPETVRRDLIELENEGLLHRVHGGAVPEAAFKPFHGLKERNSEHIAEKTELAVTAMRFIAEGDTIGVDIGSTAIPFARELCRRFDHLTVITHSLDVFNILATRPGFRILLCGGEFDREENIFTGALAENALRDLRMQKSFVFPYSVSLAFGICDHLMPSAALQRQYMTNAEQVFVLADSSKFEKRALIRNDDMRSDYVYVTDSGLAPELAEYYRQNGRTVITG